MRKSTYILPVLLLAAGLFFTCGFNEDDTSPYLVKIVTAPGEGSPEMGGMHCRPGQTLTLYALVYDEGGELLKNESVTWDISGDIGTVSPAKGESTVFTADSVRAPDNLQTVTDIGHVDLSWTDTLNVLDSIDVGAYRVWQKDLDAGTDYTVGAETESTYVPAYSVTAGVRYGFYVTANLKGKVSATASNGEEDVTGNIYVTSVSSDTLEDECLKGSATAVRLYANTADSVLSAILFSTGERTAVIPDSLDSLKADIYLDNTAGLELRSVSRLDSVTCRQSLIHAGSGDDFAELGGLTAPVWTDPGYATSQPVDSGAVYYVYTADSNYVILKVEAVDSTGADEYIDILFGWQGIVDSRSFKAAVY